jgi:hypothetical protein
MQLPSVSSQVENAAMGTSGVKSRSKITEMQRQRRLTFSLTIRSFGTLVFYVFPVLLARLMAGGKFYCLGGMDGQGVTSYWA